MRVRRSLPLNQKGNGGKDNPVLSVVPQGFTASSISACIMKHISYETRKDRVPAYFIVSER